MISSRQAPNPPRLWEDRTFRRPASNSRQPEPSPGPLRFAGFLLDRHAGRLTGPDGEVRLRPQTFRLLEVLVESGPRILSQEELLDRVWGVEHLSPASVKQAVSELRQALGDDPAKPRIVETVHRRGYRFIAEIAPDVSAAPDISAVPVVPAVPATAPERPRLPLLGFLAVVAAALLSGAWLRFRG